jgi:hypothetical protein
MVVKAIKDSMKLTPQAVMATLASLRDYGNTSVSCSWYAWAYCEAVQNIQRGQVRAGGRWELGDANSVIGCYTEHRPFGEPTEGSIRRAGCLKCGSVHCTMVATTTTDIVLSVAWHGMLPSSPAANLVALGWQAVARAASPPPTISHSCVKYIRAPNLPWSQHT